MPRDPRALLLDVRDVADDIFAFIAEKALNEYRERSMVHAAVERKFEIVGEALNQLRKIDPEIAGRIPDLERIIAFRNLLIHGYATVDQARVWEIARVSLPEVRRIAASLLDELERG